MYRIELLGQKARFGTEVHGSVLEQKYLLDENRPRGIVALFEQVVSVEDDEMAQAL